MKYFKKVQKNIVKHGAIILVLILACIFFLATSSFNLFTQDYAFDNNSAIDFVKWGSPDETANYIFAKLYAQEGRLSLQEKYNLSVDNIIRPRSFRSDQGIIKPVSFLGIILLYGGIANVFGYQVIPFLTPFFASLGLIFFYLLIKRIFNPANALLSTFLLSIFPPYIYYTSRSMFHNVLFTVLFIIALYWATLMAEDTYKLKKIKYFWQLKYSRYYYASIFSGLFFAGAIMTRTSELLWLIPTILLLYLFNWRNLGIIKPLFFVLALFIGLLPMFYYNHYLYGSYFYGGYPQMNQSISALAEASSDILTAGVVGAWNNIYDKLSVIKNIIFHFGYNPNQSWAMFQAYFVQMFAWLFWTAVLGLLVFIINFKKSRVRQWIYLSILLLLGFILTVYYGSWEFHDNPDLQAITIGNSYTRYWLPIYLGAIPLASLFFIKLSNLLCFFRQGHMAVKSEDINGQRSLFVHSGPERFCLIFFRSLIIIFLAFIFGRFVLFGSEEGLVYTAKKYQAVRQEWVEVLALTEANSTIITRYQDKLFFPERKVIVGLFNDQNMNKRYAYLAKILPLYYYNFKLDDKAVEYLNNRRLAEVGLHIELVKDITNKFSLYRLR